MNSTLKIVLSLLIALLVVNSCSRKKDKWLNKNFHAMGTKYNILYNGNIALERGREKVDDAFTENYWDLLPVERMQVSEEIMLPGQTKNSDFERAEEKANKAVQKHGMNINGKEVNPQIDEAYLLLGQARYFDQRFVPALQAFNYILFKYPASDKINEAKVWREKTNIRLDNNELAIKNLKRLLKQEKLEDQDFADANAMMAQAYINIQRKDTAITLLQLAAENTKKDNEIARYNYIRGQLYNEFGKKDSANLAFQQVIDLHRKVPRPYYINAHLAQAANFDMNTGDKLAYLEYLTDLEEDRENRPFLNKIYNQKAEFYLQEGKDSLAIAYYNKSLRTNNPDRRLRALNYTRLGDMRFDFSEYKTAGSYYDSTMSNQVLDSKPYRIIKKKRDNLEDVIYYADVAQRHDSILNLVNLSDDDRMALFTAYTDELRLKAEKEEELQVLQERRSNGIVTVENTLPGTIPTLTPESNRATNREQQTFYFYNPQTVAYGRNEFVRVWGDRSLADNWRLSDTRLNQVNLVSGDSTTVATVEQLYDPQYYIDLVPKDVKVIDSLIKDRNYAYYQLGVIYKEKFKENEFAKQRLETLLALQPEDRLILPSKYNLYQIYAEQNNTSKAEEYKSDIINNYSDSRYAEILRNPDTDLTKDMNSPESIYENVYNAYANQDYAQAIQDCEKYIDLFEGEPIVPKFEILKASALGRLYGFARYRDAVNFTALTYPNSPEGKRAIDIMKNAIPLLEKKDFLADDDVYNYKVLYPFAYNETEGIERLRAQLVEIAGRISFYELKISVDTYDEKTKFVVIHGLNNIIGADGFADVLKEDKYKVKRPCYTISSPNYEIIQMHKNLDEYLESK
ncbi:protein involved in gliding motility SprE [Flavobacteriaceae bacterium MAR_2010_188]|nr:protein involved in gliding motility SprE [Flavobacteriaceae bacterium MAR_2010_188]